MSDPRHGLAVPAPVKASGPLGLCSTCCAARKADPAHPLAEAVTLMPAQVPVTEPGGMVIAVGVVALGQCWEHVAGPGPGGTPRLVAANGVIPRT